MNDALLYLDAAAVDSALCRIDALAAVADALTCHAAGNAEVPSEATLRWAPEGGGMARTLNMPGLLRTPELRIGTKIINASTENPARGLPRADGLMLLFDPVTARPQAILQGAAISALRTAAVSTLAAQRLCCSGAGVLGVVGAGPLGRRHVTLMLEHVDIGKVLICDRVPARAAALVAALAGDVDENVELVAVATAQEAVGEATVVVTATTTTTPYIGYDELRRGAVVVNVSLDDLHEDAYLQADRLYVDDWNLVVEDSQRLLGKLARSGRVSAPGANGDGRRVDGTLGELLAGDCPGRDDDRQIIVVNPFGLAIEDLAIASRVHDIARRDGIGVKLAR
jgi:ornithine cyclodeaminase/alanine dehydrogenase-like protein (mu-crystallin family)